MSVGLIVFLVTYLPPIIPVWRRAAYVLAYEGMSSFATKPDPEDVGFGIVMGFIIAGIWPIAVPVYIFSHSNVFLKAPGHVRRQQERQAMQRRIDELEREVGVGPWKR